MRSIGLLICVMLGISVVSCGSLTTKNKKNVVDPNEQQGQSDFTQSKALDITSFPETAFLNVSIDKRCDGVKAFFANYVEMYLKGVAIADEQPCRESIDDQSFTYHYKFKLINDASSLHFETFIIGPISGDVVNYPQLTVDTTGQGGRTGLESFASAEVFKSLWTDKPNIINLDQTLVAWVKAPQTKKIIFGVPYDQFVDAVLNQFSSSSVNNTVGISEDKMSFTLTPDTNDKTKGEVHFLDVSASSLGATSGYLGCHSIECLNDHSVRYNIYANELNFSRQSSSGSPTTPTVISGSAIKFSAVPANK